MKKRRAKSYEMKIDLVELAKTFLGKWVAVNPEDQTVVASGSTAAEVYQAAFRAGVVEPLVTKVLNNYGAFVPCLA